MSSQRQLPVDARASGAKTLLPPEITEAAVREQLEKICASAPFRASRRCQAFLGYIVSAALEGRLESLKERSLGVQVFARDPNYDTNQDPVVRGTAGEVRKRLAQYYQLPGNEHQLRIDLTPGSYAPEFRISADPAHVHATAETPAASVELIAPSPPPPVAKVPRARSLWLPLAAIVTAVLAVTVMLLPRGKPRTAIDQFWAPVIDGPGPVLLCIGQPKVYHFLEPLETEMTKKLPGPGLPRLGGKAAEEKMSISLGNVVPMWDRYIALGDAMCLSHLTGLLQQKGREYHIRGGGSTSFADLRENSTVLLGAFTNDWALRLAGQLRFTFERDPNLSFPHVRDSLNPGKRDWQLKDEWPDWKMPVDYAIVSRVLDTTTGRVVVIAGGITQYGTAAAGEFLTNPAYFSQAVKNGPRDWPRKNIQVVLSTKVIGGTAGPPVVLATHYW